MKNVTFERDGLTLVVKEVPARICTNCGEDYVDEQVSHEILGIAERMAKSGALVDAGNTWQDMPEPADTL